MGIVEARLAVRQRRTVELADLAAGRGKHRMAGCDVPFGCWRQARIDLEYLPGASNYVTTDHYLLHIFPYYLLHCFSIFAAFFNFLPMQLVKADIAYIFRNNYVVCFVFVKLRKLMKKVLLATLLALSVRRTGTTLLLDKAAAADLPSVAMRRR